ncbi:XRE family transcriptional regulator [Subtercola boreus]|nr:XRE family transcriptional regulator [Subtercola boreus]
MGARIRELRRARGQTLVQLASATGMSQPFLSLVERGHARLSLASMGRIATEFGVQPGDLLAHRPPRRSTTETVDVVYSAHRDRPAGGDRSVWQLAEQPGGLRGVEMFSAETVFTEFGVHDEDEFVYVLAGILEVGLEDRPGGSIDDAVVESLAAGGSVTFQAGTRHAWRAAGPAGFRVLVVTAPAAPLPGPSKGRQLL